STAVSRRTVPPTSASAPVSSPRVRLTPMRLASRAASPLVAAPRTLVLPVVLPAATVSSLAARLTPSRLAARVARLPT
ncbi:unnamed protein product, partial [Aureobasidium vineae]